MSSEIVVQPRKNGTWFYERRDDDGNGAGGEAGFKTRGEAIAAAREDRDPSERVLLLQIDGSLVGELDHAETGSEAQAVDVEPAESTDDAEG